MVVAGAVGVATDRAALGAVTGAGAVWARALAANRLESNRVPRDVFMMQSPFRKVMVFAMEANVPVDGQRPENCNKK